MSRDRKKPPSDRQLVQAAELRIQNYNWEAVGRALRRSASAVRRWPLHYPDRWRTAIHHAERRLAIDGEAESVVALRQLLRDDDSAIRWHAAKSLVALRIELAKLDVRLLALHSDSDSPNPLKLAMELLEGIPDEELENLVSSEYERAGRLSAAEAGAVPACPP
jgi:pimeloyl-ACP methyl ester carboxylesterase